MNRWRLPVAIVSILLMITATAGFLSHLKGFSDHAKFYEVLFTQLLRIVAIVGGLLFFETNHNSNFLISDFKLLFATKQLFKRVA